MKFAHRTDWPLQQNKLMECLAGLKRSGETILDLTESNPTRCDFPYPVKKVLAALGRRQDMTYSPSPRGLPSAREAVCAHYARKNIKIHPEQVFLTASTSEGYSFLFRLLVNPQEGVLFPRPSYPLFDFLGGLNDVAVRTYPLIYEEGWRPDLEKYRSALTPNIRAVVMVNPNNPTGSFIREADFVVLNALAARQNIPMISDEVFGDYVFDEGGTGFSASTSRDNLVFVLGGLSKSLGLPQMKLAWIIVNGPPDLVHKATERLEVIADTYLSVSTPVQNALPDWLDLYPRIHHAVIRRVQKNWQYLNASATSAPGVRVLKADGGWSAVLKLPADIREEPFVLELLQKERVLVYPGYFFDFEQEPVVVVGLLPEEKIFREAVGCLLQKIKK